MPSKWFRMFLKLRGCLKKAFVQFLLSAIVLIVVFGSCIANVLHYLYIKRGEVLIATLAAVLAGFLLALIL